MITVYYGSDCCYWYMSCLPTSCMENCKLIKTFCWQKQMSLKWYFFFCHFFYCDCFFSENTLRGKYKWLHMFAHRRPLSGPFKSWSSTCKVGPTTQGWREVGEVRKRVKLGELSQIVLHLASICPCVTKLFSTALISSFRIAWKFRVIWQQYCINY